LHDVQITNFIVSKYYYQASSPFYKTYTIDSGEWGLKRMKKKFGLVLVVILLIGLVNNVQAANINGWGWNGYD